MAAGYKVTEFVGTSPVSISEAAKAAVAQANRTIHHVEWFEASEGRGRMKGGKAEEFQVTLKIGFKNER